MARCALITGITGQDGSYLAEFLLQKGYEVHGLVRRSSQDRMDRIDALLEKITLHEADLLDEMSILRVLRLVKPDEIYNLAAQSFVPSSWSQPLLTGEITGLGVTRILEAIRCFDESIRFFQASSSEMFGQAVESPQTETTPIRPRSPYGVAKAYGHFITVNYRESHGLFAVSGILFNHESARRGIQFVSRKITRGAARIKLGKQKNIKLGNLDAQRDWGHAQDFVRAMWMMLNQDNPVDYVVATGEKHSVVDLAIIAFDHIGLNWRDHVRVDESLYRPVDVDVLCGDATRIRTDLGWQPEIAFEELIRGMVDADLEQFRG